MSTVVIQRNLENDNFVWDTNTLAWVKMTQPIPTGEVVVTAVAQGYGRQLYYGAISAAPGTTSLVNSQATFSINVVSYVIVMSATGTAKFHDGVTDLTGAMPLVANSGVSAISDASTPLFTTGLNNALLLIMSGGTAYGHFCYFLGSP